MARHSKKKRSGIACVTALALTMGGAAAWADDVSSAFVTMTDTAAWTTPSPDPSGIAYIPGQDRIVVSDAEVDEIPAPLPGQYRGANLYTMTRGGLLQATGTTKTSGTAWSVEPTGLAYNKNTGSMFVVDDDKKSAFEITNAGGDGVYGTNDDTRRTDTGFKTTPFGNTDPEGIAYDHVRNELLLVNGQTGARFYRLRPGPNGVFDGTGTDDVATEYDLVQYGVMDPEGIAYDEVRDTILVSDDGTRAIYELDQNGALLNKIDLSSIYSRGAANAADVVMAPSSSGSGRSYYLVDRGRDNNSLPEENDGKVFEIRATMPAITNHPPVANAGVDQMLDLGETVTLTGAVLDKDATDTHTVAWTVTGPAPVTMATPNALTTTATFTTAGTYEFSLTAKDSKGAMDSDKATVRVFVPGAARDIATPILASSDDAQEGGGTSGTFVDVDSPDNELGNTGGANPANVLTGLRFGDLPIPKGSEIVSAKIQFKADEGGNDAAAFRIWGEATDNAGTYLKAAGNITARTKTAASVPWSPPAWNAPAQPNGGESGPGQLTPDLKTILQEIVNRPGWAKGNAAAFMISGTGRRTAESKDGLTPPVLMVGFKSPLPNAAPVVNAGAAVTIDAGQTAALDGTVTDDGRPGPVTASWSKDSGPGTVSFANAAAVDTTATFSEAGSYTLRLTADDGALSASATTTVNVRAAQPAPTDPSGPRDATLTAAASGTLVKAGRTATITGTLAPAENGQVVKLQRRTATGWVDVATRSVTAGAQSTARFDVTSGASAVVQYRLVSPATATTTEAVSIGMTVMFYRADILRVIADKDVVKLENTGVVPLDLGGWVLKNKKNGRSVRLPSFTLKPDRVVRIHTGDGASSARHLYLDARDMWGRRGTAVLKDRTGVSADRLRY